MDSAQKKSYPAPRPLKKVRPNIFTYQGKEGRDQFMVRLKYNEKTIRKWGFPNITKAQAWRKRRQAAIEEGRLFPEEIQKQEAQAKIQRVTFGVYAGIWMNDCRARGLKHTTLMRYQGMLDAHLLPAFQKDALIEINRIRVRELVADLNEQGLKPKTIKNVLGGLSALFAQAIEDEIVDHNPASRPSKLIKVPKRAEHVQVFTHEEEIHLLETAHTEPFRHYYPFVLCLFRTGLREGEGVALMPEDLELNERYVQVRRNFTAGQMSDTPKNGKQRTVDLSPDLTQALKNHLVIREAEGVLSNTQKPQWLFTTPQGGIIRSNNFRDRVWKPLLKAAGLRYRWVHATRHTFATRMIMDGANLVYVQEQLGHSSIQITVDTYTHWINLAKRTHTLEVDRLIKAPPENEGVTVGVTKTQEET